MQPVSSQSGPLEYVEIYSKSTFEYEEMGGNTTFLGYFTDREDAEYGIPRQRQFHSTTYEIGTVTAVKDNQGNYYLLKRVKVHTHTEFLRKGELEQKINQQRKRLRELNEAGFPDEERKLKELENEYKKIK